jgi:two-component system, NtrC family, sensor kinase
VDPITDPKAPGILYVDDEAANRLVFGRTFEKKFKIWMAETGEAALAILDKEPVGVLLADQRLPGMLGTELLAIAKEKHPSVVRMVLTAYSEVETVLKTINEGLTSRYILKPWSRPMLQEVLSSGLEVYRFQTQVQKLQLKLMESERLSTMGTLLASVTHDIRNPLSYLCAYADTLGQTVETFQSWVGALKLDPRFQAGFELPQAAPMLAELEELPQVIDDMVHGLGAITTIVQGIQNHVRRSGAPAEPADPTQTLQYAARLIQGAIAQAGGKLQVEVGVGVGLVALSTVELSQVLLNLLTNAAQAFADQAGEKVITVQAKPERGGVEFKVIDTGPGMTPEVQQRAFEQFFTTKPAGVGTGLGLANCKHLVEDAGGTISLSSVPGKGTTFTFWVPAAK